MNKTLINIGFVSITVIILLILLEIGVRIKLSQKSEVNIMLDKIPGINIQEKVLNFYYEPSSIRTNGTFLIKVNKDGFRDYEYPYTKPNDTVRIAVVGDSFTFGVGIENSSGTYPKKLEKMLNQNSQRIEVINFGMGALNALDIYYVVKNKVLKYNPDIIIYGYFNNDPQFPSNEIHIPITKCLDNKFIFYSYYFITEKIQNIVIRVLRYYKGNDQPYTEYTKFVHSDYSLEWQCIKQIFKQYEKLENNITIIVFNIPDEKKNDITINVETKLQGLTNNTNIKFLKISSQFWNKTSGYEQGYFKVNFPYDHHYNEKGYQIIAEILSKEILALN